MTPWTGPGAWRSCRDTVWDPQTGGSSRHTGSASRWWSERGGGGYYGAAFKGERKVTQGDPLSPTIFNVEVDVVVLHLVTGVIVDAEERGKLGKEGRHQAALFYSDDGMVASSDPAGYRVRSTPWSACLIGWACGKMLGRQSAWYATPARRRGICWKRRTGGGSRGKAPRTGSV